MPANASTESASPTLTPMGLFEDKFVTREDFKKFKTEYDLLVSRVDKLEKMLTAVHNHTGALMIYAFVDDPDPSSRIIRSLQRLPFDQAFVDNARSAAREIRADLKL